MAQASGTFANQDRLPHLPLPTLEATCAKYLATVEPLLTPAEFEETKRVVGEFENGAGKEAHAELQAYRETVDNYVEEFWNDTYLEYSEPLPINVNPIFVLEDDPTPSRNSQVARAASLILSSIKFVRAVRQGTLTPDLVKTTPLCMSQFANLFASARLPVFRGKDGSGEHIKDRIVTFDDSRHILVMSRGQFYYFDVVWPDGTPAITQREICRNLERILADSRKKPASQVAAEALSVLTSEDRATWASARRRIINLSVNNQRVMRAIDSALFVVCLDDTPTQGVDEIAANLLHGTYDVSGPDGVQTGTCLNRWFDKLQVIVTGTGNAGVNFEHSAVDGHTVLRFASDVFTDTIIRFAQTISGPRVHSFIGESSARDLLKKQGHSSGQITHATVAQTVANTRRPETRPRKLEFDLEEITLGEIQFAERRLSDLILQNEVACLEFTGYGKQYIVQNSMSPDAFVQLAMLSAYHQMYGRVVNTYESVQTKSFLHGRTEAARSASAEAVEFLKLWARKGIDSARKVEALRAALKKHSTMTGEAAKGMGVDRHLFAMRALYQRNHPDRPLPAIFTDRAYQVLGTTILSTSNCGNPSLRFFGFGPVSPQGFGVGYIIKDDAIHFCVTSKHRQTKRFVGYLQTYLGAIQDVLLELEPSAPTPRDLQVACMTDGDEDTAGYGFFGDDLESDAGSSALRGAACPAPLGRELANSEAAGLDVA